MCVTLALIRYPFDILDRFWYAYNDLDDWTQLNTSSTINSDSDVQFRLPSVVMSTASTPKNPSDSLSIVFSLPDKNAEYYSYLHFAEVEMLQLNQSRLQYIIRNGDRTLEPFAPPYLTSYVIESKGLGVLMHNLLTFQSSGLRTLPFHLSSMLSRFIWLNIS
ncbi:Leucine-rich repeat transmembrane protein kinase protein [Prunus dulcis]|uniref:Leucine-rich repeat transmembrane protein kinase protein n=1 Tax=Prunus dulcis TaxID=3755 RepID=A0A5H2XT42_PRUDU|nr:Leucine-rich repeat transmembrane protein kinase protein [Prunus dulcis]